MQDVTVQKKKLPRYEFLDVLRGLTLISMILYHTLWDLVYIADVDIFWFWGKGAYVWQQSICWTFICLAGFCWPLGRKRLKRGCVVFFAGALVTGVTLALMPGQRVVFGVLTLLGSCMLLMIPLDKALQKVPAQVGIIGATVLFVLTKTLNEGFLGIGDVIFLKLPEEWYDCGWLMTYIGFTDKDFYSTDYFSLLPWFFLFTVGYFLNRVAKEKGILEIPILKNIHNKPLAFIGRNSLGVYLLHQPVIYGVVSFFFL